MNYDLQTEEELQALIETVNDASENINSEVQHDPDVNDNDPSQNDPSPEGNFETPKENETAIPLTEQTNILKRQEQVRKYRMSAKVGLDSQAKKMLKVSNLKFPSAKIGDTVKLRVPDVDRARSDPRNLLAVILQIQDEEFYQLGTREGRLSQLSIRNKRRTTFTIVY
ncbi:hypothetical protein QE152_g3728 [Popillia japonica]|uniref:Uncharacterized protein n=1 Tax=Popillia japonica TaxID=7064 RepID=A0AAW1N3Q6_POPJA